MTPPLPPTPPLLPTLVSTKRAEVRTDQGPAPPCTGFYFSEKYCPATATGPARPPPPQDLLTASLKLTGQLKPVAGGRFGGGSATAAAAAAAAEAATGGSTTAARLDRNGTDSKAGGANGAQGWSRDGAADGERWSSSNGKRADLEESSAAAAAMAGPPPDEPRAALRRLGTYERERQQRCSVLHYLTVSTVPQEQRAKPAASPSEDVADGGGRAAGAGGAAAAADADAAAANDAASPPPAVTSCAAHPDGATAAGLLAAMRERPWEGRPGAGTAQDWAEWLEYLDPTLERHLRWLVVDGLAVQTNRDGGQEARFAAVRPPPPPPPPPASQDDETVEPGGQESAGRLSAPATGGKAAVAGGGGGGAGPGGNKLAAGSSMLAGGVRIMKSRPIKMVKPWR